MSLFGKIFDGDRTSPTEPPSSRPLHDFTVDRDRMFNLELTHRVHQLLAVPEEQRDDSWYPEFFAGLWNASIEVPLSNNPFMGPDRFDYMRIDLPAGGSFESDSLANLVEPCVREGCGVALYALPTDGEPAYIIPMGVLESLFHYGEWRGEPSELAEQAGTPTEGSTILEPDTQVVLGTPSPTYLSENAAFAMDRYLKDEWKIAEPRVLLMTSSGMRPSQSLVINRRRSEFADEDEAQYFGQCLLWFLPPSRAIILLPEDWNETDMVPLASLYER
jgi:hypothetical protein